MRKELANDLNDFAEEVHALAMEKGWWDPAPSFPEIVAALIMIGGVGIGLMIAYWDKK